MPNSLNSGPTGGVREPNHLLSAKKTKRSQRKLILIMKYFSKCSFYMTCRLQKPRKPLEVSFLYIYVYQSKGKTLTVLQYISYWSSKIKMFQNQIGRFQTVFKKTLTNTCMLEFSNIINTKVAKFSNASPTGNQITYHLWKALQ